MDVDETRVLRVVAEFAAQPGQMDVHGAGAVGALPHLTQQFLATHHLTGMGGQVRQHVELQPREVDRRSVDTCGPARGIQSQPTDPGGGRGRVGSRAGPAEHGPQTRPSCSGEYGLTR